MAYLVMVMACIAATTIVAAAADSSTGCRQSTRSLHRTARLLKGQGARGLWCWVMDMVDEVVSIAVAVTVAMAVAMTMAVLRATSLLRGWCLQAAWMGVAQGQVTRGGPSTWGVLLTAGWESGHGRACIFCCCTWQTRSAFIWWE